MNSKRLVPAVFVATDFFNVFSCDFWLALVFANSINANAMVQSIQQTWGGQVANPARRSQRVNSAREIHTRGKPKMKINLLKWTAILAVLGLGTTLSWAAQTT